jgi:hypothetical protein
MLAVLAGTAGAGAEAGAMDGDRAIVRRSLTLAPGAFVVPDDDTSFANAGAELAIKGPSTYGTFTTPLFFHAERVRISKVILYAYDNGPGAVCLGLYRTTPANGDTDPSDQMGSVCSTGSSNGIRMFEVSMWNFRRVGGSHGPYLYLSLPGLYTDGYGFYGAKVVYTYDE